ncbi:MAG: transposase, partial [Chloroflexota bacterium]
QGAANEQAALGYSRDHRPDCKQVCIALVVSREGMPLGYEVFAGNRADATTVEDIVAKIEAQYGSAGRIWVMDRGMVSEENLAYLRAGGRRYIVGTPRSQLKRFAVSGEIGHQSRSKPATVSEQIGHPLWPGVGTAPSLS